MAFRINSSAFFLTYPHSNTLPATLGAHLESLSNTKYCLVAKELHADGEPHLHAFVIFSEKKNIRQANFFDHDGRHPNIVSPRDRKATVAYIKKDAPTGENLYESGEFSGAIDKDAAWRAVVDATTAIEVHQILATAHPREYVLHHDKVEYFANKKQKTLEDYDPPEGEAWILPDEVTQYLTTEFLSTVGSRADIGPGASPRPHLIYNPQGIDIILFPRTDPKPFYW
jgi:hypothetical protein